jgi:hypothetical protein
VATLGRGAAAPATRSPSDGRGANRSAPAAPARPDEGEPGPLFLVAAYTVLLVAGVTAGLLGAFLLTAGPRIGGTLVLPVGILLALVLHPLTVFAGLRLTGTRAGTLTPLVGWSMVVLPLSSGTTEGDVVLAGTPLTLVYLFLSVLTFGLASFRTRPTRGQSARGRG